MNERMQKRRDELMQEHINLTYSGLEPAALDEVKLDWSYAFTACHKEYLKLLNEIDDECNPVGLEEDYVKLSHEGFDKLQRALGHIK